MPGVFTPHDRPLLTREQGKLPQNVASLPNLSIMGVKICDWNSKKQEVSVGSLPFSDLFNSLLFNLS